MIWFRQCEWSAQQERLHCTACACTCPFLQGAQHASALQIVWGTDGGREAGSPSPPPAVYCHTVMRPHPGRQAAPPHHPRCTATPSCARTCPSPQGAQPAGAPAAPRPPGPAAAAGARACARLRSAAAAAGRSPCPRAASSPRPPAPAVQPLLRPLLLALHQARPWLPALLVLEELARQRIWRPPACCCAGRRAAARCRLQAGGVQGRGRQSLRGEGRACGPAAVQSQAPEPSDVVTALPSEGQHERAQPSSALTCSASK